MSKNSLWFILFSLLFMASCSKELDIVNPNEPTLDVLAGEEGLKRLMLGMYSAEDLGYVWIAQAHHECMGDALYIPWGNFSWRWANQPTSITLDDGTVVLPPQGGPQGEMLVQFNSRAQGDNNAFNWEWSYMYRYINIANLILQQVETTQFEADGDQKRLVARAFANYWKAFAYSRLGSLYSAAVITDVPGASNNNYADNAAVIAKANADADLAIADLAQITNNAVYNEMMTAAVPSYMRAVPGIPSPTEMARDLNSLKARNLLVNTKVRDMTNADWNTILTLTANGLQQGDAHLEWRTATENANFDETAFNPFRVLVGWHFISPRLIQDFKPGDDRFTRNFSLLPNPIANQAGRGIQYGTVHGFIPIESGGDYASTTAGLASLPVAASWEENALMRAEALIMTDQIDAGLAIIDAVRNAQNAGLAPVSGTGLSKDEAYEELRRERRVALLLRGLPFYDARRWGVTEPVAQGGGRTGCVVYDAQGNLNTNATFNYNYLNYWGVPENELDFNVPSAGSASVAPR